MSTVHAALGSILHLLAKTTTDPLVETLLKNHLGAVGAEAVQLGTQVLGEAVAPAVPVAAEPAGTASLNSEQLQFVLDALREQVVYEVSQKFHGSERDNSGFITKIEALALVDAAIAKLSPKQVEANPLAKSDNALKFVAVETKEPLPAGVEYVNPKA